MKALVVTRRSFTVYSVKIFVYLIAVLFLFSSVNVSFCLVYPQISDISNVGAGCYLGFSQELNFPDSPYLGVPSDTSLVAYWTLNEVQVSSTRLKQCPQ
jgi:hypothetical protein